MLKKFFAVSLAAFVWVWASLANAATPASAELWLQAMGEAYRTLSFRGNLIFEHSQGLNTVSIVRDMKQGRSRARMVYLDGEFREVIRDGDKVTFLNTTEVLVFEHGEDQSTPENLMQGRFAALGDSYQSELIGRDRVAGRSAVMISVVPLDRHRYGYQLWLDELSGLLLKSLMVDEKGVILERLQFTWLNLSDDIRQEELSLSVELAKLPPQRIITHTIEPAQVIGAANDTLSWQVGWVPKGFNLTQQDERNSPVGKHPVDSLMYSDGLASFSLFVELDDKNLLAEATERNGATTAISRVFRDQGDFYMVTVVGEIPLGTAERIAVSIAPKVR